MKIKSDADVSPQLSDILIPIWQRVLKQPSINKESNFFDSGADLAELFELFGQVSACLGRNVPPALIYQAPTLEALTALLERPILPRIEPLVLIKSGVRLPPIFMVHGVGGSALDFFNLMKHVSWQKPTYCLQTRGLDGNEQPFERIEDAAEFNIGLIREIQPHGPYTLMGFSLGGVVVLETARRLAQGGEPIARLVMIDAYPHPHAMPPFLRGRVILRRMLSHALHPSRWRLPGREADELSPAVRQFIALMRDAAPNTARVRASAHLARMRYRPSRYAGAVQFIRSSNTPQFPPNPRLAWGKHIRDITVETIPGTHLDLVTVNAARLAQVLTRCLAD